MNLTNAILHSLIINNVEVKFEIIDDEVFTNSLQVAEVFEKRHDNVMQIIKALPKDEFGVLNFKETYKDTELGGFAGKFGATRKDPYYNLTRDGFSLLVMSFLKSRLSIKIIHIFNKIVNKKNDYLNPFITAQLTPLLPSHDFLKFSKAAFVSLFLFLNPPTIIQLSSSLSAHALI